MQPLVRCAQGACLHKASCWSACVCRERKALCLSLETQTAPSLCKCTVLFVLYLILEKSSDLGKLSPPACARTCARHGAIMLTNKK